MRGEKEKSELLEPVAPRKRTVLRGLKQPKPAPANSARERAEAVRKARKRLKVKRFAEDGKTGELKETSVEEWEVVATFDTSKQISHDRNAPTGIIAEIADRIIKERQPKGFIEPERTDKRPPGTLAERFAKLDQYAKEHPEKTVTQCVAALMPELARLSEPPVLFPKKAPALWAKDKQPNDTPPDFIKRHYAPWLGKGLGRAQINNLDPRLYMALSNWLRNNDLPTDLDLPTIKEQNDRTIELAQAFGFDLEGLAKLAQSIRNRS